MKTARKVLSAALALVLVLALAVPALAAEEKAADSIRLAVKQTDIQADGVINYGGYGSLSINGNYMDWDNPIAPQIALIDRDGTFLFPYREDTVGSMLAGNARFQYSDGIASLVLNHSYYSDGGLPQYYHLDGSRAAVLQEKENEYTNENGESCKIWTTYMGGPMWDGYAVVIEETFSIGAPSASGLGYDFRTFIMDKNGTITCELPEEYNVAIWVGAGGFGTKKSLGRCGEGLFAFDENDRETGPYVSSVGKGYMDCTGKTVIDLEGRGYTDLGVFSNGLARVWDSSGKIGFIDKTGSLVIPCKYDSTGDFSSDGVCAVRANGKWGYINTSGDIVVPFEYDSAYGGGSGLASVVNNGKCGLVDYNNRVVLPLEYDDISSFEGGVAYAIKEGIVYIITEEGKPTASPSAQTVQVDGKNVAFDMYALNGGATNYIRVRDLAAILNGTAAQFDVGYDEASKSVTLASRTAYEGTTSKAPFNTDMAYTDYTAPTYVDGKAVQLEAIQIEHNGLGYTYYKLRDLGEALGFNVGWDSDTAMIYIETDKPYDPGN